MPKRRVLLAAAFCFATTASYAEGCLGGGQPTERSCETITGISLHTGFEIAPEISLSGRTGRNTNVSHRAGWYHMGGLAFRMQRVERFEDRRTLQMIMVPVQN